MKRIKVIIVDDEPDSRELLGSLLADYPDLELVAEAANVKDAIGLILKKPPDLLFLDIQMPKQSGFDLIAELRNLKIEIPVIFVTAFDHFAIKAIKSSALDYLLKPIDPVELAKALEKFRQHDQKESYRKKFEDLLGEFNTTAPGGKLRFNNRNGYLFIDPGDILYLEADGNYTTLILREEKKEIISNNIGAVEKLLPPKDFLRISRSLIINSIWLNKVDRNAHQCILNCEGQVYRLRFSGTDIFK